MSVIDDRYNALGGPAGFLGAPVSDEQPTDDGSARFRLYEHGAIYWLVRGPDGLSTQTYEVHGAIYQLYLSMNRERSGLGLPTTDETPCPDGAGRFNHFETGAIYWGPATGVHEIHGSIWDHWAASGWERGPFGYPRTSEYRTLDEVAPGKHLRISSFEHGFIAFDETNAALTDSTPDPFDGLTAMVAPIYWGSEWDPANPKLPGQSWQDVDRALDGLINAGIGDGLRSYGIASVIKAAPTWLNEQVPPRFFLAPPTGTDPAMGFTDKDLTDRITAAVVAGVAPVPQHTTIELANLPLMLTSMLTYYCVFLPQGCHFTDDPWGEGGHHGEFTFEALDWTRTVNPVPPTGRLPRVTVPGIRFAWVGQDNTLDITLRACVHEFVEAFDDAAGVEIGDRCQAGNPANPNNDGFDATIAGVSIRSYWSVFHNRCIAPPALDPVTQQPALQ
jgi:LGFP repeat-containing protein